MQKRCAQLCTPACKPASGRKWQANVVRRLLHRSMSSFFNMVLSSSNIQTMWPLETGPGGTLARCICGEEDVEEERKVIWNCYKEPDFEQAHIAACTAGYAIRTVRRASCGLAAVVARCRD